MRRRFSERIGRVPPRVVQLESMDPSLRNSLWNLLLGALFQGNELDEARMKFIAARFLKTPVDEVPDMWRAKSWLKAIFFSDPFQWWHVFDLVEFIAEHLGQMHAEYTSDEFTAAANKILEEGNAGYRFVDGVLAPITNTSEIGSIEGAIEESGAANLYGTQKHLTAAIQLLSKKPNPDFRNSIKESISAVESLVKQITADEKASLGTALSKLDAKVKFHGAFKSGLLQLYGYTSDEHGIRHAMLEVPELGFDDAKFMLVMCSAFVNFIIAKAAEHGLLPSTPQKSQD